MKKLTWMILVAVGLVACSENESEQLHSSDRGITFAPQMVSDWNTTRGEGYRSMAETCITSQPLAEGLYLQTIVTTGFKGDGQQKAVTRGEKYVGEGETTKTFGNDETFYVSGYRYGSGETVADVTTANFLVSAPVTWKSGWWKAEQTFTMPYSGDKTDFFAWFVPKTEINEQVQTLADMGVVSVVNSQGAPQVTYSVPSDIAKQPDLMTAVTRGEVYNDEDNYTVPLSFAHQLTAVNFVMDDNMVPGTITEIAFLNVYMSGTLTIGGTWDFTNGSKPNAREFDVNFPTVDSNNQQVAADSRTILDGLMMIPQTFTNANQKVRVTMTIDNQEQELFADLTSGDTENPNNWEAGKTVTYKISTSSVNTLRISGVTYPTTWSAATGVKSAYANTDALGVYGVDNNGAVKMVNKKVTLTGGNWTPADGTTTLFVPGYTYYAYYPYQETLTDAPAMNANVTDGNNMPSAADFFAGAVTAWTPAADQHTVALLNAQDLQIGKSSPGTASTVSFTMAHTMGLASIEMASAEVPNVRYIKANNTYSYTTAKTVVTTSNSFIDNLPCDVNNNNTKHFFVVKPSTDVTFSANSTALTCWTTEDKTANVAAAGYTNYQLSSPVITRGYIYRGWLYDYTGGAQTFTAPVEGDYTIECWGAQGGDATRLFDYGPDTKGGKGGYTRGTITLAKNASLYVYVGQEGGLDNPSPTLTFNGGGGGINRNSDTAISSASATRGGGATDVRLVASTADDGWSGSALDTRIMIAGGGGGTSYWSTGSNRESITGNATGGGGGGINGCNGHISYRYTNNGGTEYTESEVSEYCRPARGGTQTSGGAVGTWDGDPLDDSPGVAGSYGQGATGANNFGAGGGGGYYGGASGAAKNALLTSGGGGSSFVSGATDCIAIETYRNPDNETQIRYNNVNYVFTSIAIINGESSVPKTTSFSLDDTETGHSGNGYARITSQVVE